MSTTEITSDTISPFACQEGKRQTEIMRVVNRLENARRVVADFAERITMRCRTVSEFQEEDRPENIVSELVELGGAVIYWRTQLERLV